LWLGRIGGIISSPHRLCKSCTGRIGRGSPLDLPADSPSGGRRRHYLSTTPSALAERRGQRRAEGRVPGRTDSFRRGDRQTGCAAVSATFQKPVCQPRHHSAIVKLLSVLDLVGSENSVLEGQSPCVELKSRFFSARATLRAYEPTSALSRHSVPNGGRPTWNSALITVRIACSRSRPATSVCVRAA
jgi:hypothetical protein